MNVYYFYGVINYRDLWNYNISHIRSIDISRYRHNYEGFFENFIYPIFINKGRMTATQGT